ncbi:putative uncharacterized protein [Eggerthella sp. CAG:209]|nr:putative uncharacterized protein [Eggerthella sp. CAG:209]
MSLINKFKSLLPISSRSFHAAEKHFVAQNNLVKDELLDIKSKQDELFRRIEQADNGINGNLNAKYDAIDASLRTEAERNKLRMEALFRKAYPNDTPAETRRRIFSLLPEAEGNARIMQKANGRLMFELDALCKKANLPYWTSFGSLIGALSRNGFIPWDDDIDICMMREDVDKLKEICANNPDFQLTLVYDGYVFCRQVRFSSRNQHIPCFVDICIWDWAPSPSKSKDDALRSLRVELMDAFVAKMNEFPYWGERGLLYSPDSGSVAQCIQIERDDQDDKKAALEIENIETLFSTYQGKARAAGLLCSKDKATAVAYGLDNLFNAPWRKILYPASMMFPVKTHAFEGGFIDIPNDAYSVADECNPGWPYLPDDILGHNHFTEGVFDQPETKEALLRFIES